MQANVCYNCFQDMGDASGSCPHCGYDPGRERETYPLALPHGSTLGGRYILGRVLGQGGFGITYVAQDYKTKSLVAIKEFFPESTASRTNARTVSSYSGQKEESFLFGKERFLEEAETLAEFIGNENIVRVHSYFEENNTAYFVMDYVKGISLQEYVTSKGGRISWGEAAQLLLPVMDALAAVHAKGIIHRDVTPDNIVIDEDGNAKLLDFGAARYSMGDKSRSLDIVLKHGYAPKEQYTRHGRQGAYTDVYSLAATFYSVITGRLLPDSIDRMDRDDLILPSSLGVDIPEQAEDALVQALSVQAEDRFQSMSAFKHALTAGNDDGDDDNNDNDSDNNDSGDGEHVTTVAVWLSKIKTWLSQVHAKNKIILPAAAAALVVLVIVAVSLSMSKKDDGTVPVSDISEDGNSLFTDDTLEPSDAGEDIDDLPTDTDTQTPEVSERRENSLTDTILETSERGVLSYTVAIEPQYEDADQFSEHLAPVKMDGKWGYIDEENNLVIPCQYDMACLFSEGYAVVASGSGTDDSGNLTYQLGFVDAAGNYTGFRFNDSDLQVYAGEITATGTIFHNGLIRLRPTGSFYRLFTAGGNVLDLGTTPDDAYYWMPCGSYNEGLVPIQGGPNYYGWADGQGNIVKIIETDGEATNTRTYPGTFNQGLAFVIQATYDEEGNVQSQLGGFMDRNFQWVTGADYEPSWVTGSNTIAKFFGNTGIATMKKDGKFGAIDKTGQTEILFRYEELLPESEGMILFKVDGQYGYLDAETRSVAIPAQFELASTFLQGVAVVYDGSKASLIDRAGATVPGIDSLKPSAYFDIAEDGTIISIYPPSEYVVIEEDGRYGYGHIEFHPELPDESEMDAWAYEEAASAIAEELVPVSLQNLYRYNITREDMCALITETLEKILGKDAEDIVKEYTGNAFSTYVKMNSFQDCASRGVIVCNALQIVSGEKETVFNPYGSVSRRAAAIILQRTAKLLGIYTDGADDALLSDADDVGSAYTGAVNYVLEAGIMTSSNGAFRPRDSFTREQAFISVYRLLRVVTGE